MILLLQPRSKGLFRKKSKENIDYDEYVCPMDIQGPSGHCVTKNGGGLHRQNSDPMMVKMHSHVSTPNRKFAGVNINKLLQRCKGSSFIM